MMLAVVAVTQSAVADGEQPRVGWLSQEEMAFAVPGDGAVSLSTPIDAVVEILGEPLQVVQVRRSERLFDCYRWDEVVVYTRPGYGIPMLIETESRLPRGPRSVALPDGRAAIVSTLGDPWYATTSQLTWIHSFVDETWYFVVELEAGNAVSMRLHRLD